MGRGQPDLQPSGQPSIPPAPKRQVFLLPANTLDDNSTFDDVAHGARSEQAVKAAEINARRNYGIHSCNTALLPQTSKHSRTWLYRRFYEPIELQVETLSAVVARGVFVLWYLTLIAALVLSVIPEAQWTIKNFCDLSKSAESESLKHLDRWQSECVTVTPASGAAATEGTFDVSWTGTGYDGSRNNLERFRRVALSLATPTGMMREKQTYALTARVDMIELSELVSVLYNLSVTCRQGRVRCDVSRLPEELLSTDSEGGLLTLRLLNVPAELAAPLSPTVTGQTNVTQSLASVGLTFQKKSYSLGTIVWRYLFMFLTLLHFIRFLANRKYTSSLYEQSWVLLLQLALFWYMDPLIALNVTMRPVPSVLSFVEFRLPTYFVAITLAFMFAVMSASMTWKQRSEEPAASYMRRALLLSKNVYAPPNWTKLAAALYIAAVFILDIVDAAVYQSDWISGSNANDSSSPIYWTVYALLIFGVVVCLALLYYLRGYLGTKSYLKSRPQQLACRVFLAIFLSALVFYIIHCFVFFLHYNRSYGAVYARQPFIQFPTLMVAPMLVNIMTLVYTTRYRNESVPVLATDQRWMGIVWPDSWYRWLARHGGSQYIFNTEEEETAFYRLQFQFRCRQLMAHLKKKQNRARTTRRQQRHAYSEDALDEHDSTVLHDDHHDDGGDTDHLRYERTDGSLDVDHHSYNNSFGSITLSALPSFVVEGLRNTDAHVSAASSAADANAGGPSQTAAKSDTHDPAAYRTPASTFTLVRGERDLSALHSSSATWGAAQDPLARTYTNTGAGAGGDVGILPGKVGRRLLNMDRFSTYYLPPERREPRSATNVSEVHADPLARTYGGEGAVSLPHPNPSFADALEASADHSAALRRRQGTNNTNDSAEQRTREGLRKPATASSPGYTVCGPARHRSLLQQRAATMGSPERRAHPPLSPNHSLTIHDDHTAGVAAADDAHPTAASRWDSAINATLFMNALSQAPAAQKNTGGSGGERSRGHVTRGDNENANRDTSALHTGGETADHVRSRAESAPVVDHLRSYEVEFGRSSDDESDDWWHAAAAHGGAKGDKTMGFFRGIANAIGSAVQTAEWHLIVNPVRQLERWQDAAFDAAYRPFDSTTYLPFFNLETSIDCYNMSWEAYGVKESAGDAAIETGLKLAPRNVPATVKHGVSKVFCGCCAASESDMDEDGLAGHGSSNQSARQEADRDHSASTGDEGDHETRFPEDIPEDEDPTMRESKDSVSAREEDEAAAQQSTEPHVSSPSSELDEPGAGEAPTHRDEAANASTRRNSASTSVPINDTPDAAGTDAPPPDLYPINVGKYGYELLFVTEIRDVQLILVRMNLNEPEHQSKAPRLIVSFRGTANLSNAKYDANLHRVVWKEMERAPEEDEARSAAGGGDRACSVVTTAAASSFAGYTGCLACWRSCARKSSWRPTVHAGFLSLWKSMQSTVLREIKKALVSDAHTVYRIFTTGHSLGGALAALAAYSITRMLLRLDYPIPEVTSYTFGQPRLGNRTFRNAYDKAVPRSFRVMNESDMVATMTSFGGYHVGIEVDIDRNGNFIVKPTEIEKMFPPTKGRGLALMNHLMSSYGVSMNAIAKARSCPARALMTYETADPEKRRREKANDRRLNLYPPSEAENDPQDEEAKVGAE